MTMSVAHVIASDRFAGTESHVRTLACAQADAGLQIQVLGGDPARMEPELAAHGVEFTPVRTPWDIIRALRRNDRVDVVQSHLTASDLAACIGARLHTPVVATRHIAQPRGSTTLRRWVCHHTVSRAVAAEIAVSAFVGSHIGVPSTVVHAGVHLQPLVSSKDRDRVILVAQRMEPEKATSESVSIVAQSGLLDQGWRLHLAGDGQLRPAVEAQIASLGVSRSVTLLGHVSNAVELMRSAAILIAPPPGEPYGLSVIEAMASGLPVLASGAGGHLETVGSVRPELLYAPGDVAGGARALAELAADAAMRDRVGRELHIAQRERFTIKRQLEQTLQVYRRVL